MGPILQEIDFEATTIFFTGAICLFLHDNSGYLVINRLDIRSWDFKEGNYSYFGDS